MFTCKGGQDLSEQGLLMPFCWLDKSFFQSKLLHHILAKSKNAPVKNIDTIGFNKGEIRSIKRTGLVRIF